MRRSNTAVLQLATTLKPKAPLFATSSRALTSTVPAQLPRLTAASLRPSLGKESSLQPPAAPEPSPQEEDVPEAGPSTPPKAVKPARSGRRKVLSPTPSKPTPPTYFPVRHSIPTLPSKRPVEAATVDFGTSLRSHLVVSFSSSVQLGSEEPVIAVVNPYEGVDSQNLEAVQRAVAQIGGEIVELDLTAALALGRHGPLGDAASCLNLSSNPLMDAGAPLSGRSFEESEEAEDEDEESMSLPNGARLVRVNLPLPKGLSGGLAGGMMPMPEPMMFTKHGMLGGEEPHESVNPAMVDFFANIVNTGPTDNDKPLVIYLQHAAEMHATFDAWWPSLVHAVARRRRGAVKMEDDLPDDVLIKPTTIVLGVSPSLLHVGNNVSGQTEAIDSTSLSFDGLPAGDKSNKVVRDFDSIEAALDAAKTGSLYKDLKAPDGGREEPDEAKLWMSSPEADEGGRKKRLAKRIRAMDNGIIDLPYLLPPFGPQLSDIPASQGGPPNPLAALFGGGNNQSSLGAVSTKFPWRLVRVLPYHDNIRYLHERRERRQLLNVLQVARAVSELGCKLEDPMSAVGELKNKSSSHVAEAAGFQGINNTMWLQPIAWSEAKELATLAVGAALQAQHQKSAGAELAIKWRDVLRAAAAEDEIRFQEKDFNNSRNSELPKLAGLAQSDGKSEDTPPEPVKDAVVEALKVDKTLSAHQKRLLGCIVDPGKLAETTFEDVHLPEKTIDGIRSMVSMPLLFPEAFSSGILKNHSTSGALLFGPPGTGKTLLVRALARESGARMLAIQPSDVNDMYVGEGEKLVKAVFSLARRLSPCVVFLDEVDALFGARSSGGSASNNAHRQILTEFMQEMDGLSSAAANRDSKVMIIGASNRPFDLDEAVLRRLPRRILVDLPDADARQKILEIMLRHETLEDDVDLKKLAEDTASFSGSDLKNLCVSAAFASIKEKLDVPWKKATQSSTAEALKKTLLPAARDEGPSPQVEPIAVTSTEISMPEGTPEKAVTLSQASEPDTEEGPEHARRFGILTETTKNYKNGTSKTTKTYTAAIKTKAKAAEKAKSSSSASDTKAEKSAMSRTIASKHFKIALSEIRASASEDGEISALRKWSDRFGEGGTQSGKKSGFGKGFGFGDEVAKDAEYGKVRQD